MKKRFIKQISIAIIAAITLLSLTGCTDIDFVKSDISQKVVSLAEQQQAIFLEGPYEVVNVIDGDTILVALDSVEAKVRLIGVDTPESVHSDTSKNTKEGKIASDWATELLKDEQVYLEFDVEKTDKYGRLLAYVYLSDEKIMVNKLLLEEGLAKTMSIQPNIKYADEFNSLQILAQESQKGLWKEK